MVTVASAQTVKDWYWPDANFNKVSFYMPDINTGEPTDMTRIVYYIEKGNNYEVTNAGFFKGTPDNIELNNIKFVGNEVKLVSSVLSNSFSTTNKNIRYSPTQTIFRIPDKGHSTFWTFKGEKYSASYTTFMFNGNQCNAIKVIEYAARWGGKTINYYIVGYGMVETDITSESGKITVFNKFNDRTYDDTVSTVSN